MERGSRCSPQCMCSRHKGAIDLTGRRFERLTAIKDVGVNKFRKRLWECQCDCGGKVTIPATALLSGNTKSCGCYKIDRIVEVGHRNYGVYGRNGRKLDSGEAGKLRCDAFSELTEEAAYWVGFLMADGYINRAKRGAPDVALCLAFCDVGHVEKFKPFLGSSRKITISKGKYPAAIFSVSSGEIVARLESLGVTTHKTLTAKVSDELLFNPYFWRGVIDGDGSLHFSKKMKFSLSFIGSKMMCQQFLQFSRSVECGWGVNIYPRKTEGIFATGLSGREAVQVAHTLYSNAMVSLDRKQRIYDEKIAPLLGWANELKHSMVWTPLMREAQSKRMLGNQLWRFRQ